MARDPQRERFEDRLTHLIVKGGVIATPATLVHHRARLGLTSNEVLYVLHILAHKWGPEWPYLALAEVVEASGVHERNVREWKAALIRKGYLRVSTRGKAGGGRLPDRHDLSGLFAALEQLVQEERSRQALSAARAELPEPSYPQPWPATPQPPRGKPALRTRNNLDENSIITPDENSRVPRTRTAGLTRTGPAGKGEPPVPEPGPRGTRSETGTSEPGLFPGQLPPGLARELGGMAASQPGGERGPDDHPLSSSTSTEDAPGYSDDGIAAYVEQYGIEFGDDDPQRSLDRAHRLWWNSGLARDAYHLAVKRAWYATRERRRTNSISGSVMAYFFGVLQGAIADECLKAGLPLPRDGRSVGRPRDGDQPPMRQPAGE